IDVASGVIAFSGLPVVVNPGAGVRVVLRGLTIKALTVGTGTGIDHQSGILFVENTVVDGWNEGLVAEANAVRLTVKGSIFRNNQNGLRVAAGSTVFGAIDQSFFENSGSNGIFFDGGTGRVTNTVMSGNAFGGSVSSGSDVTFQRCEVSGNDTGLSSSGGAVLRVSGSAVTRNNT